MLQYCMQLQIYCLYKGSFIKSAVLTGSVIGGRFGNSITNLGDLNNDGFEGKSLSPPSLSLSLIYTNLLFLIDVAVSAPYEEGGMVYIFYGQELDDKGSIINTKIQQVFKFA